MIRPATCYVAVCDACGEPLRDVDSEAEVHFATETEARRVARSFGWPVTTSVLICPEQDAVHQAAIDRLMPAQPVPSNQPTLDEEPRP